METPSKWTEPVMLIYVQEVPARILARTSITLIEVILDFPQSLMAYSDVVT
jgi:hypothetical protein